MRALESTEPIWDEVIPPFITRIKNADGYVIHTNLGNLRQRIGTVVTYPSRDNWQMLVKFEGKTEPETVSVSEIQPRLNQ